MAIKTVMVFQQVTLSDVLGTVAPVSSPVINYASRQHIGGWTELLWWPTDSVKDLMSALKTGAAGVTALLQARAAIMSAAASIIGVKLYSGGAGKGATNAVAYPGNSLYVEDIPQMALLCKSNGLNTTSVRRFTLRGVPDSMVDQGEFKPTALYANLVADYFNSLKAFGFKAIDPATSKKAKIFNIDAGGNVKTTDGVNPFAVPSIVLVSRTVDLNGNLVSFKSTISAGAAGTQFKVDNWTAGACVGGTALQNNLGLFLFDSASAAVSRVVTRRVGRPFESYRGRRSKRRKAA
jgi:hypothetical protein